MTPERYHRVKQLFSDALERSAAERPAFVAEACSGDDELGSEVRALLDLHEGAGSFLEFPPTVPAAGDGQTPSRVGQRVGPYELRAILGEGGMGVVYRAQRVDGEFAQEVAVKLGKRGLAGEAATRRFRAERQILARLEHGNIARLLDGGATADGLPYFVMELVEGSPIDAWCAERGLTTAARLELFLAVCAAVSYAHQRLVIHRDIKPANILCTAAGVPKLLDFGIAKLTEGDGELTQAHQRLMTPRYASPEQLRGEPVTTATDVHALGLLLYQLLCGRHPFGQGDGPEVVRRILEEEPVRPSALGGRELRGDLDNIVLMALAKDPARRYPSVEQLADDVRRHRDGLPVTARAATFAYRAGKLLRRHWLEAGALAGLFVALVAGVAVSSWQARVAGVERARAERRFEDVRRMADAMLFELHDAIAALPGATAARALLVKDALAYLDRLVEDAGHDAALALELAAGYRRLGDVQGNPDDSNLGDRDAAVTSYRKALAIVDGVLARDPGSEGARHERARLLDRRGDMSWTKGDDAGALGDYRAALELLAPLAAAHPDDLELRREQAGLAVDIGDVLPKGDAGRRPSYQGAIAALRPPLDTPARRLLSVAWNKIGDLDLAGGDPAAALQSYRTALALREAALAEHPGDARALRDHSSSLTKVGNALLGAGDARAALQSYRRALEMDLAQAAIDKKDVRARRDVAVTSVKVAELEDKLAVAAADPRERLAGFEQARDDYQRARAIFAELDDKDIVDQIDHNLALIPAR